MKMYGISSTYEFGSWIHSVYCFLNPKDATRWLYTESYNFCDREIMSRECAIDMVGLEAVNNAIVLPY